MIHEKKSEAKNLMTLMIKKTFRLHPYNHVTPLSPILQEKVGLEPNLFDLNDNPTSYIIWTKKEKIKLMTLA